MTSNALIDLPSRTQGVAEAWKRVYERLKLKSDEKAAFESRTADGLQAYLSKLNDACERRSEGRFSISSWFEPLFKAVELFTPAAAVAVQAYPNPASLVLGGIVGVLQVTERYRNYQKRAMQELAKMGTKTRKLLEAEVILYKNEDSVQRALVPVYGDIIEFCLAAFRFVTETKARVIGRGKI